MKKNEAFFNKLKFMASLETVESTCLSHPDLYFIKHSDLRGITVALVLDIYEGRGLFFDKNGNQLSDEKIKSINVDVLMEGAKEKVEEFLLNIKPKMTFEHINKELNYEDAVSLVEEINITHVVIEKDGDGKVIYVVYDDSEYKENPNYWRFFFDEDGRKINLEEFESRYYKDHEFKFFTVYNKMFERSVSTH